MRTIEQAETECRAHWNPYEKSWRHRAAWNIHHNLAIERLMYSPSERIDRIIRDKPKGQRVARLDSFRVVSRPPKILEAASSKLEVAISRFEAAHTRTKRAILKNCSSSHVEAAYAKLEAADAEVKSARAKWHAVCLRWANSDAGRRQHALDAPLSRWNGNDLGF